MRHELVLAIGWLLVSTCSASPQDKAAPLPQDRFVGEWLIDTAATPKDAAVAIPRLVVSNKANDWSIKAWWDNGGGQEYVPLAKVKLSLLGDGPTRSKSRPYGFATFKVKGGQTIHLTLRSEKENLVVETFIIFEDKLGVPNIRTLGKYKKK